MSLHFQRSRIELAILNLLATIKEHVNTPNTHGPTSTGYIEALAAIRAHLERARDVDIRIRHIGSGGSIGGSQ